MEEVQIYVEIDDTPEKKKYIVLKGDIKNDEVDIGRFNKEKMVKFEIITAGYSWAYEPDSPKGPIGLHPAVSKTKPPASSDFWQWSLDIDQSSSSVFYLRYPKGPPRVRLEWFSLRIVDGSNGKIIDYDPKIRNGFPDAVSSTSKVGIVVGAVALIIISFGLGLKFSSW